MNFNFNASNFSILTINYQLSCSNFPLSAFRFPLSATQANDAKRQLTSKTRFSPSAFFVLAFCSFYSSGFSQPFTDKACIFEIPADLTIGNSMTSTNYASNYFPTQSGIVIKINGHFIIDVPNFEFENCTVVLGPNADIQVIGSNNLTGDHSNFYSCNFMWQGIRMMSRGQINLLSCVLQNAKAAVDLTNGRSTGNINACRFDKNQIGIQATNITVNVIIGGNTFERTGTLLPVSGSAPPPATQLPLAGIRLNHSVATIGDNISQNTFTRQAHGVLAEFASSATIRFARFENNTNGVWASDGSIKLNNPTPSQFVGNTDFDIFCDGANADVFANNFTDSRRAFHSENNLAAEQIIFTGNIIWQRPNSPAGSDIIYVERSIAQNGTSNRVNFNQVFVESSDVAGIFSRGITGANDRMSIFGNHVYLNDALSFVQGIEIDVQDADQFHIAHNTIHSANQNGGQGSRWGVYVHDGDENATGHYLGFNTVVGENGEDLGMCAMHDENFPNCTFACNNVNNTLRGVHFFGGCNPSEFISNTLNTHKAHGLVIQSLGGTLGEIGQQRFRGNLFNCQQNPPPSFGEALLEQKPATPSNGQPQVPATLLQIAASQFFVRSSAPSVEMPNPVNPTGWFLNNLDSLDNNDECPHVQPEPEPNPPAFAFSLLESSVIEGNSDQTDAALWDVQTGLLSKMLSQPSLQSSTSNASEFFNNNLNSSAGLFAQFEYAFSQASSISASDQSNLNALTDRQNAFWQALKNVENELLNASPDSIWFEQRKTILDSLQKLTDEQETLKQTIRAARSLQLQAIKNENAALPKNELFEKSRYAYNDLRIRQLNGESLNASDTSSMITVVQNCPELIGKTWGLARTFLPTELRSTYYVDQIFSDDFGCAGERSKPTQSASFSAFIVPNPVIDKCTVRFEKPYTGTVDVLNSIGETVHSFQLKEANNSEINVQNMASGLYFVRFSAPNGQIVSQKLTILR